MLAKVRQLAVKVTFSGNSTLEQCRENIKILRSIEDRGFVRFSSRLFKFSPNIDLGLGIEDDLSYDLAWFNSHLKMV